MTKRQRRSEPLKTVFTETVDEGGWEVDDTLMDENTSTVANVSIQLRENPTIEPMLCPPIVPLPPSPPHGYVLGELSDDEYIMGELSP